MNQNKMTFEERQIRRRNRKVNSLRFTQGIKELFAKKIKLTLFLLFIIATMFVWFLFIYKPNNLDVFRLLIYTAFWLFFGLCIWGIISWFGKPKDAQKIEDDIKDILNIKEIHKIPILKAIVKTLNGYFIYYFYSPDYSKEKYEERKIDIEQKLGIRILDDIKNDGKVVYFRAYPTKKIKLRGELKDDRI